MKIILLIDDDPVSTIRISEILQETGHCLRHADDAERSKRMLGNTNLDLVIYHLSENQQHADETLQSAVRSLSLRNIPLLCVIGRRSCPGAAPEILGPKQYLVEPFTPNELLNAVEDHLKRRDRDQTAAARAWPPSPESKLG